MDNDTVLVDAAGNPLKKIIKVYKSDTQTSAGERSIIAAVSTDAIDRDREVVFPRGIDRKHFSNNPVVLWAHDYRNIPIGKCLWTKITKDGKRMIAKTQANNTPMGETIFRLYQTGDLNAFSIGFMALEYRRPNERELMERPELENCNYVIPKSQLLEYSAVPVPANPEAVVMEVSKGYDRVEAEIRQAMVDQIKSKTSISACVPITFLTDEGEIHRVKDISEASVDESGEEEICKEVKEEDPATVEDETDEENEKSESEVKDPSDGDGEDNDGDEKPGETSEDSDEDDKKSEDDEDEKSEATEDEDEKSEEEEKPSEDEKKAAINDPMKEILDRLEKLTSLMTVNAVTVLDSKIKEVNEVVEKLNVLKETPVVVNVATEFKAPEKPKTIVFRTRAEVEASIQNEIKANQARLLKQAEIAADVATKKKLGYT